MEARTVELPADVYARLEEYAQERQHTLAGAVASLLSAADRHMHPETAPAPGAAASSSAAAAAVQSQYPIRGDIERVFHPPGVHKPQANFSHVARHGNTLYLSGQVGCDEGGELVGRGDAALQAEQCFRNIERVLGHYGATLADVFMTRTYITHWAWRTPVGAVRDGLFGRVRAANGDPNPFPANTLVVVQGLGHPDYLVEIEALAALPARPGPPGPGPALPAATFAAAGAAYASGS
eukprot:tig00000681_g3062.t1